MVRDDARVADQRPHTRDFDEPTRQELGSQVQRAREAAGHPFRPSFAKLAGPPLGIRTLLKLESGDPVSAKVYAAAGRTLAKYFEDWSEDTPLQILQDGFKPSNIPRRDGPDPAEEESSTEGKDPAQVEPEPGRHADMDQDLEELLRSAMKALRRQGVPHKAIMRAAAKIIEDFEQEATEAERNDPDTDRGQVG